MQFSRQRIFKAGLHTGKQAAFVERKNGQLETYLLEMKSISKCFPGVNALENVNLTLKKGEVHVLMGENGAGKSTLMKILSGEYQPNAGEIWLRGKKVEIHTPHQALLFGLSMIHQELSPIPDMTIAENIFLGREIVQFTGAPVNKKLMHKKARELLDKLGISLHPGALMRSLNVAETQMVEIAKAVSYDAEIVIMDEPTSAITDRETDKLFEIIGTLKQNGVGIIYISHKMDEIFKIADTITVLRDGQQIETRPAKEFDIHSLITLMVGREIKEMYPPKNREPKEVIMTVTGLGRKNEFWNIDFELRRGEVLGISGLVGSGRSELLETIFGVRKPDCGEICIEGKKVSFKSPGEAIRHGIAFVPEDRKNHGLNLKTTIRNNMSLSNLASFCRFGYIQPGEELREVENGMTKLKIKAPSVNSFVQSLSGGNQQKVIIAKWLMIHPKIFLLDEPTRGIDIGAKTEIYNLVSNLANEGNAVIMVSSELPEIVGLSDRVIVMHEGRITGLLYKDDISQNKIMLYATGQEGVS